MFSNHAALFVARLIGLYVLWYLLYRFWIAPDGRLDLWLTQAVSVSSVWVMQLIGYADAALDAKNHLCVATRPLVFIGHPCNGLEILALHLAFMLSVPTRRLALLLAVLLSGWAMIFVVNAIRVAALAVNFLISRETFAFNHHYLFAFVVYAFVFALWAWWLKNAQTAPQQ
jgi:exosortase/archaeosortase family protein